MKAAIVRTGLMVLLSVASAAQLRGQASGQVFAPAQGRVENVSSSREGTTITVTYDLKASDPLGVFKVSLTVSISGSPFKAVSVTGDIGDKVTPGPKKEIVWQVASDTDNQEYDLFKFEVVAVSGKRIEVTGDAAGAAKPAATPEPAKSAPPADVRGIWNGSYAGSATASLVVDRQDGGDFSGALRLAMKAGDEPTELSVKGTVAAQTVQITEVSIVKRGKQANWNLGSGSGSIELNGQMMSGNGTDDHRKKYLWSFTRQSDVSSRPQPSTFSPDISGTWEGTYAGSTAALTLNRAVGSKFTGIMLVTTSRGKTPTAIDVDLVVTGEAIALNEIRVVANGAASKWNLGKATGIVEPDNRRMGGSGRDSGGSYQWKFTKK